MNFLELPGVSFSLSFCGEEIPIRSDGRIEKRLYGGSSMSLEAEVSAGLENWHPFNIEHNDKFFTPRPPKRLQNDGEETITYFKNIPIFRTVQGNHLVTYSQKNNLRMLCLSQDAIDIFTTALIIQNGVPWFTADLTYQAKINGNVIEYSRKWETLFSWIGRIRGEAFKLKKVELSLPDPKSFGDQTGSVIWWDSSMANAGRGCVMTNEGQVSAHWSNVERNDSSRRFLKIGELVSFEAMRPQEGRSNFDHELVGVEPLH